MTGCYGSVHAPRKKREFAQETGRNGRNGGGRAQPPEATGGSGQVAHWEAMSTSGQPSPSKSPTACRGGGAVGNMQWKATERSRKRQWKGSKRPRKRQC